MNSDQAQEAIRLYQEGHGYKTIARMMEFKSPTSIRRLITRQGLNDSSRAFTAPKGEQRHEGAQGARKDYSTDEVLLRDACLFAQRQTAALYTAITDAGFVLEYMPVVDIRRVDPAFGGFWEDVESGRLTDPEAERLDGIAQTPAGIFDIWIQDGEGNGSTDIVHFVGYYERPQLIDLITGKASFSRDKIIQRVIMESVINDCVKYAPPGFDFEAAKLSGDIQKARGNIRSCGIGSRFEAALTGVQPSPEQIAKDEREKRELESKLADLQEQWKTRYGLEYDRFIERPEQLLLTG